MRLWLHGCLRQWRHHRFVMVLLVAAYSLAITTATLVWALIAGRADLERSAVMGDPTRVMSAMVTAMHPPEQKIALTVDRWTEGIPVAWGWVLLPERGEVIAPSLRNRDLIAFWGPGPLDWSPPMRAGGRFLQPSDLQQGDAIVVLGDNLTAENTNYRVVGLAYDRPGLEQGWRNRAFVPLKSLPPAAVADPGSYTRIHLEIAPSADLTAAKERLARNLHEQLPGYLVAVETIQDTQAKTALRFAAAQQRGVGLDAVLLGFAAINVGSLNIHWLTQRSRDLGVRVALGATTPNIVGMVLFENLLLGTVGALCAAPLVLLGLATANRIGLPASVTSGMLWVGLGSTLATSLLSCLLPLALIMKTPLQQRLHLRD